MSAASALCALSAKASRVSATAPKPKIAVNFEVPRGACDAHVHIIGEPADFPMSPHRDYTPPAATADDLLEVQKLLHLDRVVIVTPTVYGYDNSATIAAIKRLGQERARGIALVETLSPPGYLDSLRQDGIAGIRLILPPVTAPTRAAAAVRHLQAAIEITKGRGWHLDISAPPDTTAALASQLTAAPVPLVFDYFGWAAGGVEQPGFDAILQLIKSGRAYVKLSEPYRLSKEAPDYPNLEAVVQAFLATNPERVLWGSGWPHVDSGNVSGRTKTDLAPNLPVDTAYLLNLFARWVPEAEKRRKILVDNAARLYGF